MAKRKKYIITIGTLLLVFLVFFNLARITGYERESLSYVEKGLKIVAAPLQGGATAVLQKTQDFFGSFREIKSLREENALLKEKVSELVSQINTLKDYRLENQRLKVLLDYKLAHSEDFQFKAAEVIGRNPNNWYRTLTINVGAEDGIKKDLPVVTHQGLVGRIINVSPKTSEVLLILDQDGAVAARVWETRDTPGVVEGKGDGNSVLSMIYLPHDADLRKGQTVVTSGLGGIFPQGIRIGKITDIIDESNGLMKKAFIKPYVNFGRLEEVLVILKVNENYDLRFEEESSEEELEQ